MRMAYGYWKEIFQYMKTIDVYKFQDIINVFFKKYWKLSDRVAIDETLAPCTARSPHHSFIPRKPYKNGIKFWGLVDMYSRCMCDDLNGWCNRVQPEKLP